MSEMATRAQKKAQTAATVCKGATCCPVQDAISPADRKEPHPEPAAVETEAHEACGFSSALWTPPN
jgi:hypothetical protein